MTRLSAFALLLLFGLGRVFGQEGPPGERKTPETLPDLPASPAQWINSSPIPAEILKEKAVVFWFFEETCPRCEGKWPEMLTAAQKFNGKPVLFVAVNSGTPRPQIEQYVRRNKITWPILLDPDRSFEKASGVNEISLQNIYQSRLLKGDGSFSGGSFDIAEVADDGLATAKWRIDPAEIPEELQPTWQQVEFGNFPAAAQSLKKNMASGKEEIKAGAEKLQAAVDAELQGTIKAAADAKSAGETWKAYKSLSEVNQRFKGYAIPADVATEVKALKGDELVKKELAAAKAFDTLKQKVTSGKFPPKSIRGQMEKFLEQHPGTEAAESVTEALAKFDSAVGSGPGGTTSTPPGPMSTPPGSK
jgi:thiol-disulfide isomerase/thioredoxin